MKRYLSTGEVAAYCGVTIRTVINWIKAGKLKAHQLPGSRGDNRVAPAELIQFLERNGMPVPSELATPSTVSASKPVEILVVDDDRLMASAIRRCLAGQPWQVSLAFDGFEAGRQFERLKPAVMTLDLQMPRLDGFQLLEQLHERAHTRILVISAMEDRFLNRAIDLGADAALSKPFANDALIAAIQALLPT